MEFPSPQSTAMEAVISLQHIFRVARAVNVDPLIGLEGAGCICCSGRRCTVGGGDVEELV